MDDQANKMYSYISKMDIPYLFINRNNYTYVKKLYPKIFNPDFQTYCNLDPIFNYYRNALIEFISRSPKYVKTINATEGGSIYGDRITSMKFSQFLSKY